MLPWLCLVEDGYSTCHLLRLPRDANRHRSHTVYNTLLLFRVSVHFTNQAEGDLSSLLAGLMRVLFLYAT